MMSGLPGGGPDSPYPVWVTNTWPHNFTDMLNYQWDSVAIPWWKEAAKKAASHGIEQIAIENHPNNLVYNVSTIRRLHEEAGEIIGLNLDPSHSFYMGGDPIIMAKNLRQTALYIMYTEKIPESKKISLTQKCCLKPAIIWLLRIFAPGIM